MILKERPSIFLVHDVPMFWSQACPSHSHSVCPQHPWLFLGSGNGPIYSYALPVSRMPSLIIPSKRGKVWVCAQAGSASSPSPRLQCEPSCYWSWWTMAISRACASCAHQFSFLPFCQVIFSCLRDACSCWPTCTSQLTGVYAGHWRSNPLPA